MDKNNRNHKPSDIPFTGLGLIFGTALGAVASLILSCSILWAGVGTGIGLVIGAALDSQKTGKS